MKTALVLKIYLLQPHGSLKDIKDGVGYSKTDRDTYNKVVVAVKGIERIGLLNYGFSFVEFENEIFKDIEGYNGDYKVSNYGRVISCKKDYTRLMALYENSYISETYILVQVLLTRDSKQSMHSVSRLVAKAFIPLDDYSDMVISLEDGCLIAQERNENLSAVPDSEGAVATISDSVEVSVQGATDKNLTSSRGYHLEESNTIFLGYFQKQEGTI